MGISVVGAKLRQQLEPGFHHGAGDGVVVKRGREPQFGQPMGNQRRVEKRGVGRQDVLSQGLGCVGIFIQGGGERPGELPEIPAQHPRLRAKGVAPGMVDTAKNRVRAVSIQEGTRAKINGLARDGGVVGIHHAMHESAAQPLRH